MHIEGTKHSPKRGIRKKTRGEVVMEIKLGEISKFWCREKKYN
jgi:hypothetical protein